MSTTPNPAGRYVGKVVLVTGAARGQGRAEVVRFAQEGADVIAVDTTVPMESTKYPGATAEDLAESVRQVEATGRRILAADVDVRDAEGLGAFVEKSVAELGRLDVVVANAGICSAGMSWEITPTQWQETLDVNLTGVWNTARVTVPILLRQNEGGAIAFTSSVAGLRGLPFLGAYVASKHAIVGLAKTMAVELGQHNIRVNTVHPHGVATGMTVPDMGELIGQHAATLGPIFMGTLPDQVSQPEDLAAAVAWLCSDEARHVTGIQLPVDLGTLIR